MNTIEQELDERYPIHDDMGAMAEFHQSYIRTAFGAGVKWQAEQPTDKLYTKEDLEKAFNAYYMVGFPHMVTFKVWLKESFGQ